MDALFRKIWRFLESHYRVVFVVAAVMTVFILFDPRCRQAWDIFFTHNGRILEIYWQTLTILLVILIPVTTAVIEKLNEDLPGFGAKTFFQQVVRVRKFCVLVPFSFLLFFALPGKDFPLNQIVLTVIHYTLFILWCCLFWWFFELLRVSIRLFTDRGELTNRVFFMHLKEYDQEENSVGNADELAAWKLLWKRIDLQDMKWREKFLGLFWSRLESLVVAKQYVSANDLLNDFAERYLELGTWDGKKRDQREHIHWMNARKRWLWFHEKQGSDGRENPFTVVSRLLDLHLQCWEALDGWEKPGNGMISDIETWGELYGLNSILSNTLEKLFRDELDRTDDYYLSFFRCLTGFFDRVGEELLSDTVKYVRYLKIFPIYSPVFEAASKFEPQSGESDFPNQWRMLLEYFEKKTLFAESEKSRGIQHTVWLNQFLSWSGRRIGHGKTDWDDTLDGALNMLFPEADASWMAWAVAYRHLSWGGSRIASLCRWDPSFGKNPAFWFSVYNKKTQQEEKEDSEKEERKRKNVAARIIGELGFFGNKNDPSLLIGELEGLSKEFVNDVSSEHRRRGICEMLQAVKNSFI